MINQNFNPNTIQLSSVGNNAFNWLFYGFISQNDYSNLQGKIKTLQHFIRALEELNNNCENQGILLHWSSIGSAFGAAASISGIALMNPLIGAIVAATAASSAGLVVYGAISRNAKLKPILEQLLRYKLALKSSPINDWAAIWEYLGDEEQFLDCLYEASEGMIANFKLIRTDKKNPFAAALDYLCPQLNVDRDELISHLRNIKNGGRIKAIKPVQNTFTHEEPDFEDEIDNQQTQIQQTPIQNRRVSPIAPPNREPISTRMDATFEVIKHLSEKIQNSFIVGLPGSGKDFLVSHATRIIKQNKPSTCLFLIDCKNDPKEHGYYEHFDHIERIPNWNCESYDYVLWFKKVWKQYEKIANQCELEGKNILVVVNEGTRTGQAFSQERDTFIKGKMGVMTSSGDSRGRNVWIMVQAPQLEDLGFGDNVRSQLFKVAILHESNVGAIGNWWKTNCFGRQLRTEQLFDLISESPRGRIVFSSKDMKWYPMPELPNLSGYDRDKREFLPGYKPTSNKQMMNDDIQDSPVAVITKRELNGDELRLLQLLDMLSPGLDNLFQRFAVEGNQEHQRMLINRVREVAQIAGRLDLLDKFGLK